MRTAAARHAAPGPVLSIVLVLKHLPTSLWGSCWGLYWLHLQMRHREVKPHVEGHRAGTCEDSGPESVLMALRSAASQAGACSP